MIKIYEKDVFSEFKKEIDKLNTGFTVINYKKFSTLESTSIMIGQKLIALDFLTTTTGTIACTREVVLLIHFIVGGKKFSELDEVVEDLRETINGFSNNIVDRCIISFTSQAIFDSKLNAWDIYSRYNVRYKERVKEEKNVSESLCR